LAVRGSGVGLQAGQPDLDWRITRTPDDANYTAKPAIVTAIIEVVNSPTPRPNYLPNEPSRAQWLSTESKDMQPIAKGDYVYEYSFDLAGIDPRSVVLRAHVSVDDAVHRVRLNGVDIKLPGVHADRDREIELTLNQGFVAGRNRLEFDVENAGLNYSGLRVALEASGRLYSRRLGDK
jgi:hypothetical protein